MRRRRGGCFGFYLGGSAVCDGDCLCSHDGRVAVRACVLCSGEGVRGRDGPGTAWGWARHPGVTWLEGRLGSSVSIRGAQRRGGRGACARLPWERPTAVCRAEAHGARDVLFGVVCVVLTSVRPPASLMSHIQRTSTCSGQCAHPSHSRSHARSSLSCSLSHVSAIRRAWGRVPGQTSSCPSPTAPTRPSAGACTWRGASRAHGRARAHEGARVLLAAAQAELRTGR